MPYETSDDGSLFGSSSGGRRSLCGAGGGCCDSIRSGGVEFLPLLLVLDEILGVEKRHVILFVFVIYKVTP